MCFCYLVAATYSENLLIILDPDPEAVWSWSQLIVTPECFEWFILQKKKSASNKKMQEKGNIVHVFEESAVVAQLDFRLRGAHMALWEHPRQVLEKSAHI